MLYFPFKTLIDGLYILINLYVLYLKVLINLIYKKKSYLT